MSAVAIFEERRRENADTIAMIRVLILLRVSSILEYRPFALSETICQMRVFGTGVLGTRYCRVPGSWYRAEGYVGPGR